jgi:aminoglycoside N3'-acetyltransferase
MSTSSKIIPLKQTEIEEGLLSLGLARGDTVEVHSSLRSFGWVEGGAAAVVDALMRIVGAEGAIIMSAYPVSLPLPLSQKERARGILAKVKFYDETYDGPSGMGKIADEFRHRDGVLLGEGIYRVCAWGRDAELHSKGYGHLLETDGYVLLLGVGIDRCSSMHLAEKEGLPREITNYLRAPAAIRRDYPEDIHITYGRTPENGWAKVQAVAERQGLVTYGRIGNAECLFFRAKPVIGIYEAALRTDPFGLFGIR